MWQINEQLDWESLQNRFGWIQDMEGVPQDKIYHEEGDVAVHTEMVLNALLGLEEFQALSEQEQQVLIAAALLHDVEKRSTTVIEEDGRISSKGHARKGEYTARSILYENLATPFYIKEAIAKLVRHHGLPIWILEKPDPQKALLKASLEVDTKLLTILAKADILGRICADQKEQLYRVALFEEFCKEHDCFGKARTFPSDMARFVYFQKTDSSPDYVPFEKDIFEVVIMSAIPGSGKDTYIKTHYKDWPVVSLDDIRRKWKISPTDKKANGRVVQEAKEQARVFLRAKKSFIWNATNITRTMRQQLIDLFYTYKAKVRIVYIEVPYKQLLIQNQNRNYPVPVKVLNKMITKLEIPAHWEAPIVEYRYTD